MLAVLNNNKIVKLYIDHFFEFMEKDEVYYYPKFPCIPIHYNIKTTKYEKILLYGNDYKIKYFIKLTSKLIKI